MKRKIIKIETEKCNGCGACADACHEGAIAMVDGKAKLMRDDYCDGLGDCLPACPMEAISFEEREAMAYDEEAVLAAKQKKMAENMTQTGTCANPAQITGCTGSREETFSREPMSPSFSPETASPAAMQSQLSQWPVQIKLAAVNANYFDGAKLLIAADCTAYAYANMHNDFIKGRITLVGCPKLDDIDYSEKLTEIITRNDIRDITVVRMEVPCCGGIEYAVKTAIQNSSKPVPCSVVTISTDGKILE